MYVPTHPAPSSPDAVRDLLDHHGAADLVSAHVDGDLVVHDDVAGVDPHVATIVTEVRDAGRA